MKLLTFSIIAGSLLISGFFVFAEEEKDAGDNGAESQQSFTFRADITYTQADTENGPMDLKLDWWSPKGTAASPLPVVVMIHGGGFHSGSRKESTFRKFGQDFASQGWHAVSISYRLDHDKPVVGDPYSQLIPREYSGIDRANAAVGATETTVDALEFLNANAAKGRIDTDRIAVLGSSAGGRTALMTAYVADEIEPGRPPVAAVVDFWSRLPFLESMENDDAPLFIVHGTSDQTVPFEQAKKLARRAIETNTPVQLHAFRGRGHSWGQIDGYDDMIQGEPIIEALIDWLDIVFSGNRPPNKHTIN